MKSDALRAYCTQVCDGAEAVDGHQEVQFGEDGAQLGHDAFGASYGQCISIWPTDPDRGGS